MKIYLLVGKQPRGPYSLEFIRETLKRGGLEWTQLGAYEGSTDWKPLRELMPTWDEEPPTGSKPMRAAVVAVIVVALTAVLGGFLWWHVARGSPRKAILAPKPPPALAEKKAVISASDVSADSGSSDVQNAGPTREMLAGKQFYFSWKTGNDRGNHGVLTFREDGTLSGGTGSPNESFWSIDQAGRLVFMHRNGRLSTVFEHAGERDGKWFFSGTFQFSPQVEHFLEETAPDPGLRLRELKRLYDRGLIPQEIYERKRKEILDSL